MVFLVKTLGFLGSNFSIFSAILLFSITYKREKNKLLSELLLNFRELHVLEKDGVLTKIEVKKLKKKYLN